MVTIRLKGGLGNQMFQYALGVRLSQVLNTEMKLDLTSLLDRSKGDFVYRDYDLDIFDINPKFSLRPSFLSGLSILKSSRITKFLRNRVHIKNRYIKEQDFHFDPAIINEARVNTIYEGWFQSPKYFEGVEEALRFDFSFKNSLSNQEEIMMRKIQSTDAVCLNVRRTDFVKNANLNTTDLDYFNRAVDRMKEEIGSSTYFIFSDDVDWCRANIRIDGPMHIVDHKYAGNKFSTYLRLMSSCDHFIIPNSSFAWWAVWIRNNLNGTVIAPINWFNDQSIITSDLIDENWIRV